MLHQALTQDIIQAFYEVHGILGFGFLEQVYQNALYRELCRRDFHCNAKKEIPFFIREKLLENIYQI